MGSGASGGLSRTKIYHSRVKSRVRENQLAETLRSAFDAELAADKWTFDNGLLARTVDVAELTRALEADVHLTRHKRDKALKALKKLPEEVQAFNTLSQINCDFVVLRDGVPYFWEFHEEQHRKLSDNRPKKLHSVDGRGIELPRSIQRLIRDWWRFRNLRPLTIVWSDWFEENSQTYEPKLQPGVIELGLANRFGFSKLDL